MSGFRYEVNEDGGAVLRMHGIDYDMHGRAISIVLHPPNTRRSDAQMLKHGRPGDIERWIRAAEPSGAFIPVVNMGCEQGGMVLRRYTGVLGSIIRIDGDLDIEEVNRFISCAGYMPSFAKELLKAERARVRGEGKHG